MSLKLCLLICSLACLTGQGLSSSLALQNCIGLLTKYYVSDTRQTFADAFAECLILRMVPITENDLNDTALREVLGLNHHGPTKDAELEEFWLNKDGHINDRILFIFESAFMFSEQDLHDIPYDISAFIPKCYKFNYTTTGFKASESNCKDKRRIVCKRNTPRYRFLAGRVRTRLESIVSSAARLGRWIKDKFQELGAFTVDELSKAVAIVKHTYKDSRDRIGSNVKDFADWTKGHSETLVQKISQVLKLPKDKVKSLLNRVVDEIDKEGDDP